MPRIIPGTPNGPDNLVLHLCPAHKDDLAELRTRKNIPEFVRSRGYEYNPAKFYQFVINPFPGGMKAEIRVYEKERT